jgi:hypothetical protein
MPKFRKIQPVIEAEQYAPGMEDCWLFNGVPYSPDQMEKTRHELQGFAPAIRTNKGPIAIFQGDWIITEENGNRRPIRPEIFAETYEAAEEDDLGDKSPVVKKASPRKPPSPKPPKPTTKKAD